jgi:hypothetical protein
MHSWIRFSTRCAAVVATLALAAAPMRASADPSPSAEPGAAVAQARQHFSRGVRLYEEDDFRAALIEFERAYELAPNWAVLYNVGQSHYQLRDYVRALSTLERYVREGGNQIAKDRRAQVEREVEELRGRVARVTVTSNVAGTEIAIDDARVDRTPLRRPVLVGAGRHKVTGSRGGYVAATRIVDIAGGDDVDIALDLMEERGEQANGQEQRNYTAAIVAGTLGAAGVAVGSVFGVLAVGNKSSLQSECTAAKVCPPSAQDDVNAFARNGTISTIGFAAGAAGLVLGGYFLVHERARDAPATSAAGVTPWIGYGSAGVVGTF